MTPFELSQQRVQYIKVTNGGDEPFTDRYDGVPFTIMPGSSQNIPLEMAAHFFGYSPDVTNETMFRHVCKRQGWNTPDHVKQNPESQTTLARSYFNRLRIEPVVYKMVPAEEPDPRTPVPADPEVPAPDAEPDLGTFKERAAKRRGFSQDAN